MAEANTTPTPTPTGTPTPTPTDDFEDLTADEYEKRLEAAREDGRKQAREAAAAERKKLDDEAARKKAEDEGRYKDLLTAAEKDRDAKALESQALRVDVTLRDYLAEKHPAYLPVARYVRPLVAFDAATTPETIAKRVAEAADQYAKDNPRAASGGGPGPGPGRSGLPRGTQVPGAAEGKAANGSGDPILDRLRSRYRGPARPAAN